MRINNKILSICIPTRNRAETVYNTLNSIFTQGVDVQLFEVAIYDSSDNDKLTNIVKEKFDLPNLKYYKGENFGFLNLNEALAMGGGLYLKLHNDYSVFKFGALALMIAEIKSAIELKPVLLFSNGCLRHSLEKTDNFNSFLNTLSFFSTWSTLFGVWKSDFDLLDKKSVNLMFPHTSLLYQLTDKSKYQINNHILFENKEVANKGGYNLFHVFGVVYLDMVKNLLVNQNITIETFDKIKKDLFYQFLIHWYTETKVLKNNYTFLLSDVKTSIRTYYSSFDYYFLIFLGYLRAIFIIVKRTIKMLFNLR